MTIPKSKIAVEIGDVIQEFDFKFIRIRDEEEANKANKLLKKGVLLGVYKQVYNNI